MLKTRIKELRAAHDMDQARLAELVERAGLSRATVSLVAISAKTAAAAGPGWQAAVIATAPRDDAMVAAARALTEAVATGISGA